MKHLIESWLKHHPLAKPMVKMLSFLAILFGLIFGYKFVKILMMPRPVQPPVSVSATTAAHQNWQPKLQAVGSLRAIQGVDITTELPGLVKDIHLKPGTQVQAGDVLVQLNADTEIALKNSLKAQLDLAEINFQRDKAQFAIHAISQSVLDADKADLKNKRALLSQQEATLAKKTIRAPFAGRIGISTVNLGQYLNTGDKVVTLQALDPIYANFSLPQQYLSLLKVGQKVLLKVDAYPNDTFTGTITTIEPKVDPDTRNVRIEATIANPDFKLYPGMFAEVDLFVGETKRYLTLPKTAISFNPFGEIVYTLSPTGKDNKFTAQQAFVTVGESRGDQIAIEKGLKEGEQVVTTGQQKLKNGTIVVINNSVVPTSDAAPKMIEE